MATYYKPSQWRGKHLVYRTTDPSAPKDEIARIVWFFVAAIVGFAIILLVSRWVR
jgi:hypothetical protein